MEQVLSTEEKARRYDEALKRAKECHIDGLSLHQPVKDVLEHIFPVLKESEDEATWLKKYLEEEISCLSIDIRDDDDRIKLENLKRSLAWLEKQSEHKHGISEQKLNTLLDEEEYLAKFKVGDWVVQENIGIYKIVEVCDSWYEVIDNQNNHYSIGFDQEYMCHLWTIDDAKDGDVLACDKEILLFKSSYSVLDRRISLYCWYNGQTDNFHNKEVKGVLLTTKYKVYPATEEQRALLFSKMYEAGYEWDSEKKELKKISKEYPTTSDECIKSAWSYEDEDMLDSIIEEVRYMGDFPDYPTEEENELYDECLAKVEWLKSLKDRVQLKPKQEWSDDDENEFNHILNILTSVEKEQEIKGYNNLIGTGNWLKSLKDRVQPKQEWSEEDSMHLTNAILAAEKEWGIESCTSKWLKSIKDRVQSQPQQEWSDEAMKYLEENHSPSEVSDFQAAMNIAVAKAYDKGKADAITEMQSPYWNKNDERILNDTFNILTCYYSSTDRSPVLCDNINKVRDWLRSIKDRLQLRLKQEWGKEDENTIKDIIEDLEYAERKGYVLKNNTFLKEIHWLKSLKDRYTWKPSDEQIEALESATENCAYSEYQDCLKELIRQLKKLKG